MTWAERVGDLATNIAMVAINLGRVVTLLVRIAAQKLDELITNLAERSEGGIGRVGTTGRSWIALPAAVAFGIAAIILRAISVVTVFLRQVTETADEFLRSLAEEAGPSGPGPGGSPGGSGPGL